MQRERQHQTQLAGPSAGGDPLVDPQREAARNRSGQILIVSDTALDSVSAIGSERWLQEHKQQPAQ